MVNGKVFETKDATGFLKNPKLLDKTANAPGALRHPWHALAAHRPLGNIMQARFKAYAMSARFRRAREGRKMIEPRAIDELPD